MNELSRALCCLASVIGERKELLGSLLKKVRPLRQELNNQGFMDLWLCLARAGGMNGGKTVEMLKLCIEERKGVKVEGLALWELSNWLLALAVLKLEDYSLVGLVVNLLNNRLD